MKYLVIVLSLLSLATVAGAARGRGEFHRRVVISPAGVEVLRSSLERRVRVAACLPLNVSVGGSRGQLRAVAPLPTVLLEPHAPPSQLHVALTGLRLKGHLSLTASPDVQVEVRNATVWLDADMERGGGVGLSSGCHAALEFVFQQGRRTFARRSALVKPLTDLLRPKLCGVLVAAIRHLTRALESAPPSPRPDNLQRINPELVSAPRLVEGRLEALQRGFPEEELGAKESNLQELLTGEGRREVTVATSEALAGAWLYSSVSSALNASLVCGGCPFGVKANGAVLAARWTAAGRLVFLYQARAYERGSDGQFQTLKEGNFTGSLVLVPRGIEAAAGGAVSFGVQVVDLEGQLADLPASAAGLRHRGFRVNQSRFRKKLLKVSDHIIGTLSGALETAPFRMGLPAAMKFGPGVSAEWTEEGGLLFSADFDLDLAEGRLKALRRSSRLPAIKEEASDACQALFEA